MLAISELRSANADEHSRLHQKAPVYCEVREACFDFCSDGAPARVGKGEISLWHLSDSRLDGCPILREGLDDTFPRLSRNANVVKPSGT